MFAFRLGVSFFCCGLCLLRLRLLYRGLQFGSGELLPVESDLGDAHLGKGLAVSLKLLVLLLALVVEDQDLVVAALFEHLAADPGAIALGATDLALFGADGQHIGELHLAFFGSLFFNANYVPGRDTILFSPGADDREHKIPPNMKLAKSILRAGSAQGLPEGTGTAGKPKYFSVWGEGRSNFTGYLSAHILPCSVGRTIYHPSVQQEWQQ